MLNYKWHLLCSWDNVIFQLRSIRWFAFIMLPASELTCQPETGSGLLRVPCPYSPMGGELLETHLENEGGGRWHRPCLHLSLSGLFHSLIGKAHHQTESHFGDGLQILSPIPHIYTNVNGGSDLVTLTRVLFHLLISLHLYVTLNDLNVFTFTARHR